MKTRLVRDSPMVFNLGCFENDGLDYWADVITPPFFEKLKFGGRKEYKTLATNDLVWSIPSPPGK